MEENKQKEVNMDLTKLGEIELPTLDVSKYVGQKAPIESVKTFEGKHGYFLKVETIPIDTIGDGDDAIILRASRIFGLQKDKDGKVGWGKETKLGLFLDKIGAKKLADLVGKDVIVQTVTNKDGKDYLSFN